MCADKVAGQRPFTPIALKPRIPVPSDIEIAQESELNQLRRSRKNWASYRKNWRCTVRTKPR